MVDLDISPPEGLTVPLWRSLVLNFIDRVSPERLPPLELTSKPVDVGLMAGDLISMPWYRTVFGNIADVVSPETLPPLQLESRPVDVGELLGDDLDRGWWDSLLRNLRDRLAPERQPALQLTSQPIAAFGADASLQILDWSTLLSGPKIFLKDKPKEVSPGTVLREPEAPVAESAPVDRVLLATRMQLGRDLGRSRFRRRIWIGLAAAEAIFLVVAIFKFQ